MINLCRLKFVFEKAVGALVELVDG